MTVRITKQLTYRTHVTSENRFN